MTRPQIKHVHEGEYAAEVEVNLMDADAPWGPYLSADDAKKLDGVRLALRSGDLRQAMTLARRVYRLVPVTAA
jgi:hypothetical protein